MTSRPLTTAQADEIKRLARDWANNRHEDGEAEHLRLWAYVDSLTEPDDGKHCPGCGNSYDGDNFCMPSACEREI